MMAMPEPKSIEGAEILIWVLTGILGLVAASALWFLKRYFKEQDTETESVKKKLHAHEAKMEKMAERMEESSRKISGDITTFKSSALDFQQRIAINLQDLRSFSMDSQAVVNKELATLEKQTDKIETQMDRTYGKAIELEQKLDKSGRVIEVVTTQVESHNKTLRTFAEIVKIQKTGLDNLTKDYSTTKTRLSEELILIRSKKSGEDSE
jgi:chromosome segregation ATPase